MFSYPLLFFGLLVLFVLYVWGMYNRLIVFKNRIDEAWSGIKVQLTRRADLIPNLINTVKGYAKHESSVFENVTKARSQLMSAGSVSEVQKAQDSMTTALKSLFAIAEAYPQLRASENFQQLQKELSDTEDKIAYSRQFYNSNVLSYNSQLQQFPTSVLAGMFHFSSKDYFQTDEKKEKPVAVSFE